jgi:hypothetical protein
LNQIITLCPKILPTLSTIQTKWQEQRTTPAVSDWKVAAQQQTPKDLQLFGPQLESRHNIHPKISPTLSTSQAKWQKQRTTPAADSDGKVAAQLQQEVESDSDSKQTPKDLQLCRAPT